MTRYSAVLGGELHSLNCTGKRAGNATPSPVRKGKAAEHSPSHTQAYPPPPEPRHQHGCISTLCSFTRVSSLVSDSIVFARTRNLLRISIHWQLDWRSMTYIGRNFHSWTP